MKVTGWSDWEGENYIDIMKNTRFIGEADIDSVIISEVKDKGYKFTGSYHQYGDYGAPIIDNKYIYRVSQRSWGDIIAQAYPNEIDDSDGFGYIDWAWIVPEGEEQILPKEEDYEETSND